LIGLWRGCFFIGAFLALLFCSRPVSAKNWQLAQLDAKRSAKAAISRLQGKLAGKLRVSWSPLRARPVMLRGLSLKMPGASNAARAAHFFQSYRALVVPSSQLALAGRRGSRQRRVLRYRHIYRGLPVIGGQISLSFDRQGSIRAMHARLSSITLESITPKLPAASALERAYAKVGAKPTARVRQRVVPKLAILPVKGGRLVYTVTLPMEVNPLGLVHTIDAHTGAHLGAHRGVLFHAHRPHVHSAHVEPKGGQQ
jgi:hypothetical protein